MAIHYALYHPPTDTYCTSRSYYGGFKRYFQKESVVVPLCYQKVAPAKVLLTYMCKTFTNAPWLVKHDPIGEAAFLLDVEIVEIDVVTTRARGKTVHKASFQLPGKN